jgi:hypothetical protein
MAACRYHNMDQVIGVALAESDRLKTLATTIAPKTP